jgi:hypothetical protein
MHGNGEIPIPAFAAIELCFLSLGIDSSPCAGRRYDLARRPGPIPVQGWVVGADFLLAFSSSPIALLCRA